MITQSLLQALSKGPRTLPQLAVALAQPVGRIEAALLHLRRGGYVDQARPDQGACHSGCGLCSMKSFCPSQIDQAQPQESWRLTDKGQARVGSSV